MTADWIVKKPKINDGSLPTLIIDDKQIPKIAEGIWHAQMAGWERILTYDFVQNTQERKSQRRTKRNQIGKDGFQRCGLTADEYPFACTKENICSAYLTNAPSKEQSIQGGLLGAFLRSHGAYTKTNGYFYFEVKVVNYVFKGSVK